MSRFRARLTIFSRALLQRVLRRRRRPDDPRRVLIAHHLLLGDTLTLTPLLSKLRRNFPHAEVYMTMRHALAPLYEKRPYEVIPLPWDPHHPQTLQPLLAQDGFDLAIVPGENRYSWLALAAGARWIRAHAGELPAYTNWPVDELIPYPQTPAAWGDIIAEMVSGPPPPPYHPSQWGTPRCEPFAAPAGEPYAVLHVGASTSLKRWEPEKWQALASRLSSAGYQPVLLAGPGETDMVHAVERGASYAAYPGTLKLNQVWHLLRGAHVLIAPDTGITHLGRIVGVPTVGLYGPGSSLISGAGEFWRASPFRAITLPEFRCRDQHVIFYRAVEWARTCSRSESECHSPRCMQGIDVDSVWDAVRALTAGQPATAPH